MRTQHLPVVPMKVARREFTRARICAAAKEVFFLKGYTATTLEDIAQAAGSQRSTLYNHFKDKNEVLAAIADDYLAKVVEVIQRLPSPKPSRAQIDAWIQDFANFVAEQRTPTVLIVHSSAMHEIPPAVLDFGDKLIEAFARHVPAFAATLGDAPEARLALARARAALRELGWALCAHVEDNDNLAPEMLTVAAELFEEFIRKYQ